VEAAVRRDLPARAPMLAWVLMTAWVVAAAGCGQPATSTPKAPSAAAPAPPAKAAAAPIAAADTVSPANAAATNAVSPANPAAIDMLPTAVAVTPPFKETFEQYAVSVYQGPGVQPDFAGAQKPYANYRTRITNGVKSGPNFAGHYSLVLFGCGLGCGTGFLVDVKNGEVSPVPFGGAANMGIEFAFRPNSRLLETVWRSDLSFDAKGNALTDPAATCVFENFIWRGGRFTVLDENKAPGMCPH